MPEPDLKQTVYVETTIPSYLKARPTTDLIRAAHQEFTRQWWRLAPPRFRLVISDAVMSEVRAGDPAAAAGRLEAVAGLPILGSNEDVQKLLKAYEEASLLPANARADLLHLAFST